MKQITYYLAGPMSGLPEYNWPTFTEAKRILTEEVGLNVVSPHEIDHGETDETRGTAPYEKYLRAGFRLLLSCGGIILLPGWEKSRGAKAELEIALDLEMDVLVYAGNRTLFKITGVPYAGL